MSGGVFTGTPPSVISITAGNWAGGNAQYDLQSSSTTEARYNLSPWPGDYDIVFSIDQSTGNLVLDVQDPTDTQQQYDPYKFSIGASSAYSSAVASGSVSAGDVLRLWTTGVEQARITVPSELAVTGWHSGSSSHPSSIAIDPSWGAFSGQTPAVTLDELVGGSNTHYVYYPSHGDATNSIKVTMSSPFTWSDADPTGQPTLVEEHTVTGIKWVYLADARANNVGLSESDFVNPRAKFQVPVAFGGGGSGSSGSGAGTHSTGGSSTSKKVFHNFW